MPFSWESIVSFFSPPASRDTSPSLFFNSTDSTTSQTKQGDLPMPPTSAFTASAGAPGDSSSSLAASERDYFPATSPRRRPSISSTSTASTIPSDFQRPNHPQRMHTTPPHPAGGGLDSPSAAAADEESRPPAPRRAATSAAAAAAAHGPLDPMSRQYPKPAHEPSLDELLSRPPLKWSLGHYVKSARERKAGDGLGLGQQQQEEEEQRRRRFEEAKRNLLRAKEAIDESVATRRR
ncbi:hypothetical protein N658DRAFT_503044 [Parathielavia hyrcaniae]|uniref:Uncharacterized protein n=1 Tax=Parathielavia hyrcaniae TaxID=113614 RepID=A0AAN6QAI5_9PEZI|nr:hypothetical protein N658DRAFT_503044 [Parathielavia hyrcaniae]